MLKAVIVEDEKASRETLRSYLQKYCPQVELCGTAEGVKKGVEIIDREKPQLVFLDIEMPYGNGFDLLEGVGFNDFEVIFITAFSEYALKAIQVSASHYLLKPISIDELIAAVEAVEKTFTRKREFLHSQILVENIKLENRQLHKIVLPTLEGFEVISINQIVHCTAEDNFTNFTLNQGKKMMICKNLKHYENLLADFDFIRIHKSHLVNKHFVQRYRKGKGGMVTMSNGDEISVSSSRKKEFLESFGGIR